VRARVALLLFFLLPVTVFARGGRGGHSSSHSHSYGSHHSYGSSHSHSYRGGHSSSHHSHSSHPTHAKTHSGGVHHGAGKTHLKSGSQARSTGSTVHVNAYRRRDGTYVRSYDRAAPGLGTSSKASSPKSGTASGRTSAKAPIPTQTGSSKSAVATPGTQGAPQQTFMAQTGYPQGRPGYVIGYVVPLECGGKNDPSNMQWQTVEEAKAKKQGSGCQH
jgi:hypothetical protein